MMRKEGVQSQKTLKIIFLNSMCQYCTLLDTLIIDISYIIYWIENTRESNFPSCEQTQLAALITLSTS